MAEDLWVSFAGWPESRMKHGMERAAELRWQNKGKARVSHPNHGSVIVPCGSCFSAVLCAAEWWGIAFDKIMDAKVELCDQSLPAVMRPAAVR